MGPEQEFSSVQCPEVGMIFIYLPGGWGFDPRFDPCCMCIINSKYQQHFHIKIWLSNLLLWLIPMKTFRTYGGQSSKCVTAFIWKTAWFSEHLSFLIWSQTFLRLFHPNPHLCQTPWSNFCQMWWKLVWSQLWSIWDDDTQTLDLPGLDPDLSPQLGLLLFHYFFISQWNS